MGFKSSPHFRSKREKHNLATSRQEKSATLLTFISADGNFFSLWIFKTGGASQVDFRIMPAEKTRQDGWPRYYAFSESGYINQQIWGTVMLLFCERFNLLHPGMNAVLFSDQLASHLNPVVVGMAYQQHVHMWSLVTNSSHFLQPLDDLPFGTFKKYTAASLYDISFKAKLLGESGANLLLEAAYEAEVLAFTKPIIMGGFARTGLNPLDRKMKKHFELIMMIFGLLAVSNAQNLLNGTCFGATTELNQTPNFEKQTTAGPLTLPTLEVAALEAMDNVL